MQVEQDAIGNLIGRYEGSSAAAKTFVLGSHLDSVRDAGRYDGPLGVMVALACVQRLHARGERLPFAIEVVGFADEEGMRFTRSYLGSRAITGTFDSTWLEVRDEDDISMAEAIRAFGGTADPRRLRKFCARHAGSERSFWPMPRCISSRDPYWKRWGCRSAL